MKAALHYYLIGYNLIAFFAWLLYLILFVGEGFSLNSFNLLLLNIAQGLAIMEIVHVLLRWVKSPIASTSAQVLSRLLVLAAIDWAVTMQTLTHMSLVGILVVSFAWGITELVRYSFYASQLVSRTPKWLLWMRYTFFIVLYPTGVTGEWLILAAPIVAAGWQVSMYAIAMAVVFVVYVYYFPVLYGYMWKQRSAKLLSA